MTLGETIGKDLVAAQKAGDAFRVNTLRLVIAEMQKRAIEKRGKGVAEPLTDAEVMEVLQREGKKRREAIEVYQKGSRADLAKKEEDELALVNAYLPTQMSKEEIVTFVRGLATKHPGDFASLMKAAMAELKGRADGKIVSEAVREAAGK